MEKYIKKALNSLENQTYQQFEVLIIDDGSTDNIDQVVKPYLARHKNWQYFKKNNGHWGSVINYVLQNNLINGNYVTILDGDDWFKENALEIVANKLLEDPTIDLLISNQYRWFNQDKIINGKILPFRSRYLKKNQSFLMQTNPLGKFMKSNLLQKIPKLQEKINFNDLVIFTHMVNMAQKIYYINTPLSFYWENRPDNSSRLTDNVNNTMQTQWSHLKSIYETADKINESYREVASHLIMVLWSTRKTMRKCSQKYQLVPIKIKTKNMKMGWLPWYTNLFPLKTYFKFVTRKWWVERK